MSNHPNPNDGLLWNFDFFPLPVRLIVGALALAFLLLICSAPNGADAAPAKPVSFSRPCRVVAGEADARDGKLDRIMARHGGVDYVGVLAFPDRIGRWYLNDTGKVFGYSRAEDGRIYSTARCARIAPTYTR